MSSALFWVRNVRHKSLKYVVNMSDLEYKTLLCKHKKQIIIIIIVIAIIIITATTTITMTILKTIMIITTKNLTKNQNNNNNNNNSGNVIIDNVGPTKKILQIAEIYDVFSFAKNDGTSVTGFRAFPMMQQT